MIYEIHTLKDGINFIVFDKTSWIPLDEGNSDYQAYLAWVAEGNEATEWNPE
jgi:hypothetical protein